MTAPVKRLEMTAAVERNRMRVEVVERWRWVR